MTQFWLGANAAMAWASYVMGNTFFTAVNAFACLLCLWMLYHDRK